MQTRNRRANVVYQEMDYIGEPLDDDLTPRVLEPIPVMPAGWEQELLNGHFGTNDIEGDTENNSGG